MRSNERRTNSRTRPQAARGLKFRPVLQPLEERCVLAAGLSASLVADIVPGPGSSNPQYLPSAGGALYFYTQDTPGSESWELRTSDGTAGGTRLLRSFAVSRT